VKVLFILFKKNIVSLYVVHVCIYVRKLVAIRVREAHLAYFKIVYVFKCMV